MKTGYLFRVISPNYHLEVGFIRNNFYILRNDKILELPIESTRKPRYVFCVAMWQPTELKLIIYDRSKKKERTLKTPPTLPPNSLIDWARREAIIPTTVYDSVHDFYETVVSSLQSIPDKIAITNMYNAFWDITYEGSKIISRRPKCEKDITPIIHGLLFDIAIAKNFQIIREYHVAGGSLDFLITGVLKTGEHVNVCVEFKHAHNPKLVDGLIKQLPAYMKSKGCDFGVYCVLYFKGKYFDEPRSYDDPEKLKLYLDNQAVSAGITNIRVLIIDLSHPDSPSQL